MSETVAPPPALELRPRAAKTLLGAMDRRSCHAFLLVGDDTTEVATWIAQRVLCPNGGCGTCSACGRIARRTHPDLHWTVAEGLQLRTDQVGQLIDVVNRTPFEAAAQVSVIEDAETLSASNKEAANRLLKALEEPSGDVVFLLLARSAAPIIGTIRSRVVEVPLAPLPDSVLTEQLSAMQVAGGLDIATSVRLARGSLSRAIDLANGGDALRRHLLASGVAADLSRSAVLPGDAAAMLMERIKAVEVAAAEAAEAEFEGERAQLPADEAKKLEKSKDSEGHEARVKRRGRRAASEETRALLHELASWYRDLAAVASGAPDLVHARDQLPALQDIAQRPMARNTIAAIDALDEFAARLVTNPDLGIALDAVCAELVSLAEGRVRSRRSIGVASV
jgi:DNA polymerase-3 subunit delta'